jgi:hypothetical protein
VGTQVVAHPLDTMVDQGADHKMAQLGHFLEAGAGLWKDIDEADQKEGKEDALMGKEMKQTALGSYERGWLHVRGTIAGAEDASKLQADYDSGKAQERQAAAMTGLFKNQEVVQDIRSSVEMLPKFPTDRYDSAVLNDAGGVYSTKVREIAAQTHTDLFRAANDAGGDVEAFSKKRTAIIEQARAHIGRVLNDAAGGVKGGAVTVPAFIQYPTWAAYVAAASRGEVPKDPELLKRTREWYESTGKMK